MRGADGVIMAYSVMPKDEVEHARDVLHGVSCTRRANRTSFINDDRPLLSIAHYTQLHIADKHETIFDYLECNMKARDTMQAT